MMLVGCWICASIFLPLICKYHLVDFYKSEVAKLISFFKLQVNCSSTLRPELQKLFWYWTNLLDVKV